MAKKDPHMEMMKKYKKHKAIMMIVVGLLVIINAVYGLVGWAEFVGGILVLLGLLKLSMK